MDELPVKSQPFNPEVARKFGKRDKWEICSSAA
jgi:hypothetical protein